MYFTAWVRIVGSFFSHAICCFCSAVWDDWTLRGGCGGGTAWRTGWRWPGRDDSAWGWTGGEAVLVPTAERAGCWTTQPMLPLQTQSLAVTAGLQHWLLDETISCYPKQTACASNHTIFAALAVKWKTRKLFWWPKQTACASNHTIFKLSKTAFAFFSTLLIKMCSLFHSPPPRLSRLFVTSQF